VIGEEASGAENGIIFEEERVDVLAGDGGGRESVEFGGGDVGVSSDEGGDFSGFGGGERRTDEDDCEFGVGRERRGKVRSQAEEWG